MATVRPGWVGGRFTTEGRDVFAAVSRAVVPSLTSASKRAMAAQVAGLETLIAGLPHAVRRELAQLLALLSTAPGRRWLTGLGASWTEATPDEVAQALDAMRRSSLALRVQAYLALRELALAAHHADPASWRELGYPGPLAVG